MAGGMRIERGRSVAASQNNRWIRRAHIVASSDKTQHPRARTWVEGLKDVVAGRDGESVSAKLLTAADSMDNINNVASELKAKIWRKKDNAKICV